MTAAGRVSVGATSGVVATGSMSMFMEAARAGGYLDREPPDIITENIEDSIDAPVAPGVEYDHRWKGVHTAFGAAMGGVFGALRPVLPRNTLAAGAIFGAGLWTTMYPMALPVAGLYPKPDDDWKPRAVTIALSHLVYGITLAAAFDTARCLSPRRDRSTP